MTDKPTTERVKCLGKDIFQIVKNAVIRFGEMKASETAASMAYYALFSLFPLLLFLITVGSYILEKDLIQQEIMQWVETFFPMAQTLIIKNIESVIRLRGTVGTIALVGMLWAATNVFYILTLNINRSFPEANLRGFVKNRLVALVMVVLLVAIMLITLVFNTINDVLFQFELREWPGFSLFGLQFSDLFSQLLNWFLVFLVVFLLYWWVPNASVKKEAAICGTIFTLVGWHVTTKLFMWYLRSGFVHYELVYGSLGTIISLMLWLYLSSIILLFGSHLASSVNTYRKGGLRKNNETG